MSPSSNQRQHSTRRLLTLLAAWLVSFTLAQSATSSVQVGVIASRTGAAAGPGAAQWLLASQWSAALRAQGGIFGVGVDVDLRDDASRSDAAVTQARDLIDAGALVIVCCTTPGASSGVAAVAEAAGVPLLAPTTLAFATEFPYWAFALSPDETDAIAAIVADAYRQHRPNLALLALEGSLGDAAQDDLAALLAVVGAHLPTSERYPAGVRELRPEALLVAASQPGGVVVWGLADDLVVAYEALRRRGYEGHVYARPELLQPGAPGLPWTRLINLRFPVAPAAMPVAAAPAFGDPAEPRRGTGGAAGSCAAAAYHDAARLAQVPGGTTYAVATAPFLAALDLVGAGIEQLLALQIPSSDPLILRQALRDVLVGRPPLCMGAGLIDLRDGLSNAVDPGGLAIGVVTSGGLASLE